MEPGKHGDAIRRKYWTQGKPCPMAICVGQAPVLGALAATTLPAGVSEYAAAGGRVGRAIDVVLGPETGLPIPADGEIVFEGVMHPPEVDARPEGPFGEWPGYYASGTRPEPVLKVAAIHYRDNPIIVGMPPAKPTLPGTYYGTAGTSLMRAATLWDDLEAAGVPGVTGVWKLPGGGSRFIDVVAIKQLHPGHAKMAGLVAAGCSGNYMNRITMVVDDDIDITNTAEVLWALSTRWDPKTQTDIVDGCYTGYIDPLISPEKRAVNDHTMARIIIYAVKPFHWKDKFPVVNTVSNDYSQQIEAKWKDKLRFLGGTPTE
jgi:4-hydroxy-3-polyprenylbenzoate decarboxylase